MVHKKNGLFEKMLFAVVIIVLAVVLVGMLFTRPVDQQNTTKITGHFNFIERKTAKGDVSYDLYITEDRKFYKISASWADCFHYDSFIKKIEQGQLIELWIRKDNGLILPNIRLVVSVKAGNESYLDPACVNKKIQNEKEIAPFLIAGALALSCSIFSYRYSNRKRRT